MYKIKDRFTLGVVAGLAGNMVKTAIDELSVKKKVSQRPFRETAAGVWVSKRSEATNVKGQVLGGLLDFGVGSIGGIATVYMLSKTGRDGLTIKGLVSGITMGSMITAAMSALPQNKVRPKNAASNLSYMVSHAAYGLITTYLVALLGHESLFDAKPVNNYMKPTEPTTEQNLKRPYLVKKRHLTTH